MSIARAQFQLPYRSRNVLDVGGFYYFGPYMAGSDMQPIAFDRVLPSPIDGQLNDFTPLSLPGINTTVGFSSTSAYYNGGNTSCQASFKDGGMDSIFESQSGATTGRKFVITPGAVIAEIKSNNELEAKVDFRSELRRGGIAEHMEFAEFIDENLDYMFFIFYSRYGDNNLGQASRLTIFRVDKVTFTPYAMTPISDRYQYGNPGQSNINKAPRYLGKLADGKHLFIIYGTKTFSNWYSGMWYIVLDTNVTNGAVEFSSTSNGEDRSNSIYPFCVPSNMVADGNKLGSWYMATFNADDDVTIVRRTVPETFVGAVEQVPVAASGDYTACTITGMATGEVLPTPGTDITDSGNYGQASMWTVVDGTRTFLVYYIHNGGNAQSENSPITPVSRHDMYVFEIDPLDSSNLIFIDRLQDAFGYSQQLPSFVRSADRKTIIVCNTNGFGILSWSSAAKSYVASPFRGVTGVNRVSFDDKSQIWIETTAGGVYVFNPDLSASVVVEFENNATSVLYSGAPITMDTYINVYTFVGNRVSRSVRLVAEGCVFIDGTSTKDIVTNGNGDTVEAIVINGQGNTTVNAYLI